MTREAVGRPDGDAERERVIGHLGVQVEVRGASGAVRRVRVARNADIVVGDVVEAADGRVIVAPRHTELVRRAAHGGRAQLLAANVDVVAILVTRDPPPRIHFIDRAAVMARISGITPVLVVTKGDKPGVPAFHDELALSYRGALPTLMTSLPDGEGLAALAHVVGEGRTVVFVGPSGVGKSSLTNALCPDSRLAVAALSDATGRGRHTTSKATLSRATRGFDVIDTPGIRDFGLVGLTAPDAAAAFPGFDEISAPCRFRDCLHRGEPGCAIVAAVDDGRLPPERLASYRALLDEIGEGGPSTG